MAADPRPSRFELSVGGYTGSSFAVRLSEDQLWYDRWSYGAVHEETVRIAPSQQDWERFWENVERLGMWEWADRYEPPGVLDGTGWQIVIRYEGHYAHSMGDNAYPPDGTGPRTTPERQQFCRAVNILVGNRPFG